MRTVKFLANLALIAFLVVTSLVLINSISYAGNLDLNGVVQPPSAYTSDGYGVVTPIPITQIDPNTFNTGIALPPPGPSVPPYPSYTINIGQTSPGTFQLQQYYAGATSDTAGGTHMEVLYNSAQNSAGAVIDPNTNMQWIQQITTTSVLPEGQSPEVDPNAKTAVHSGFPFYYPGVGASTVGAPTDYYKIGYTNSSYRFLDTPTRAATSPPQLDASTVPGLITWRGNVYLTQVNNNIITVQDGLQWGWDMKWATLLGNASGSFTNATRNNPPPPPYAMNVTGLGTSNFTWGTGVVDATWNPSGAPSSLSFAGAASGLHPVPTVMNINTINDPTALPLLTGVPFKIGTLTYYNGTVILGTEANHVDLNVMVNLTNISQMLNIPFTFNLVNTPNVVGDPVASADYVWSPNFTLNWTGGGFTGGQYFHVYEGSSATADLMATLVTARLPLQNEFGGWNGCGYYCDEAGNCVYNQCEVSDASLDENPFTLFWYNNVLYNLEILGFENASANGFITGVPEPSTLGLMALGLLGVGLLARLSRKA